MSIGLKRWLRTQQQWSSLAKRIIYKNCILTFLFMLRFVLSIFISFGALRWAQTHLATTLTKSSHRWWNASTSGQSPFDPPDSCLFLLVSNAKTRNTRHRGKDQLYRWSPGLTELDLTQQENLAPVTCTFHRLQEYLKHKRRHLVKIKHQKWSFEANDKQFKL